jgi:hypothetical protein
LGLSILALLASLAFLRAQKIDPVHGESGVCVSKPKVKQRNIRQKLFENHQNTINNSLEV